MIDFLALPIRVGVLIVEIVRQLREGVLGFDFMEETCDKSFIIYKFLKKLNAC